MWHSSAEKLLTFQNWTRTTKKRHAILNIHDKHADEINLCDVAHALSENRRSVLENSELIY